MEEKGRDNNSLKWYLEGTSMILVHFLFKKHNIAFSN